MPEKKKGVIVSFGDVVVNRRDQIQDRKSAGIERVVGLDDIVSGDLRIRTWKGINESPSFKTHFKPGQTLFGKRRAYLRKVAYAEFEGICTQNILVLESKNPNILLPELIPFICNMDSFFNHAIDTSEGSLFPNANWKSMQEYELFIPLLDEQKRIAKILQGMKTTLESIQWAHKKAFSTRVKLCIDIGNRADRYRANSLSTVDSLFDCLDFRRIPLNENQRKINPGSIPYYGSTGQVDTVGEWIFDESLVLVAEDGGPFGEFDIKPIAYLVKGKSWVNNHAHVLKPKSDELITWLFMNLVHRDLRFYTSGSTRGKLNKNQLLEIPIWMPNTKIIQSLEGAFSDLCRATKKLEDRIDRLRYKKNLATRETFMERKC
ncbi:MAG: restriction endonuclease subunit S [Ectothiorhodospiraceae bacterium AqS1]|nr:restriction endonuclease subunit S [Ectothiorhodospiraceae bacterium AqS1]